MNQVPYGCYTPIKHEIISRCLISDNVWKNWLRGRTPIPPLALREIKQVFDKNV